MGGLGQGLGALPSNQRVRMTGLVKNGNRAPIAGGGRGRHNLRRVCQTAVTAPPCVGCVVWSRFVWYSPFFIVLKIGVSLHDSLPRLNFSRADWVQRDNLYKDKNILIQLS